MRRDLQLLHLELMAQEIPLPEAEYRFHLTRRWRFDFAWPEQKIALEFEGGTWSHGRHTRGKGYEGDCEKYSEAAILGWKVIRVTAAMIRDGRAMRLLKSALMTCANP